MINENKPIYVAVESTRDYADVGFHSDIIDGFGNTKNYYRLVEMTDAGAVVPLERNKNYQTAEEAKNIVLGDPDYEILTYDQIISKSVERQNNIKQLTAQMEEFGYKREIYEETIEKPAFEHMDDEDDYRSFKNWDEVQDTLQCKQALYEELVNELQKIEKSVITDLGTGVASASGSWMGRIVDNNAPSNYLNVEITEIQRTGMISVEVDTVLKNKITGKQTFEIGKEDVLKNGIFENTDFLNRLKINSHCLETASKYHIERVNQHFTLFRPGQKENSLRDHCKWLKSKGYNEFPDGDTAKATQPTHEQRYDKKDNHEIKFNVPKGLTKTEFEETIRFFRENGAKYHAAEKIWTVKESQREKFAPYLNPERQISKEAENSGTKSPEEKVRLHIPKNLKREEFLNLIQYFKENGAKYESEKKAWFVEKSQIVLFEKYIEKEENGKEEKTPSTAASEYISMTEEELKNMEPGTAENIRQFMRDNGGTLKDSVWTIPATAFELDTYVPETDILQESIDRKMEFTDKLDQLLQEYGYHKGYLYSMDLAEMIIKGSTLQSPEQEAENATVLKRSPEEVRDADEVSRYTKGNYVSLNVADYKRAVYEIKEVCGIKEISGQIIAETQDHLILEGQDGKEISVAKTEIYDDMQTSIIKKAMSMEQNVREQIDLIGDPRLSAAQMDQILNGINEGLQPGQVALYASPKIPAWQMDIYRYGMVNGLTYDSIRSGCQKDWDSSRDNIDNLIREQRSYIVRDLKEHNYVPEKRLVHKMERLKGMTGGKIHKVSDIVNAVRSGNISNRYGEASLLKEIGDDLQHQRKAMSPAAQQRIQAMSVLTR